MVKTVRMRRAALEQWIGQTDIRVGDESDENSCLTYIADCASSEGSKGIISSSRQMSRGRDVETASRQLCQKMLDDRQIQNSVPEER